MEHTISYVYSIKQSDDSRFTDNHNFVHYKINFLSLDLFLQISYCEKLNNIIVCPIGCGLCGGVWGGERGGVISNSSCKL